MIRLSPLALFEDVLNRLLRSDLEDPALLRELDGHRVRFCLKGTALAVDLGIHSEGIALRLPTSEAVDATITGDVSDYLRLVNTPNRAQAFLLGGIDVQGDLEIANRLSKLLLDLDIDWEEHLSAIAGDGFAHTMMLGFNAVDQWRRDTAASLGSNLGEYLGEETRLLMSGAQVEHFCRDVDRFRDDVERLAARVEYALEKSR